MCLVVVFVLYSLFVLFCMIWSWLCCILYVWCEGCICLVYVLCFACVDGCVLGCVCCMCCSCFGVQWLYGVCMFQVCVA